MAPELIAQVIALTQVHFAENIEIGVEVHPRDASIERLEQLKRYGVNRCIALGVDHLSAYPLITFEHTALGKLVREGKFQEYSARKRARKRSLSTYFCQM